MNKTELEEYSRLHQHPLNLLIHIATVPIVYVAVALLLLSPLLKRWEIWWGVAVALVVYCVLMQQFGHRLERVSQDPKKGVLQRTTTWLGEQFVSFPTFLLSGGWTQNWQRSQR